MVTEIIAEIGQNHNGSLSLAKELIYSAKESGADVAKFQVYDAKKLFPPKGDNPWFDYNCATELTRDDVQQLADYAKKIDIEFMASAFDVERVGWLEEVGVKRYKIASRSVNDYKLHAAMVKTGKPLLVSLGMWAGSDFPKIEGADKVEFLYCISKYPTPLSELKLRGVDFTKYSGFSDHTVGISAACASFILGSRILEKHFTLDKEAFGPDHSCSMTPDELKSIAQFRRDWIDCK